MRKVWIVVANSTYGKIYRAENVNTLVEIKDLQHIESHLPNHELVSDRPGRSTSQFYPGKHSMEGKTSPKIKERHLFADEINLALEEGLKNKEYERLYIIAPPPFLGCLREEMSSVVVNTIFSEIKKDLTHLSAPQIREYLPPVL